MSISTKKKRELAKKLHAIVLRIASFIPENRLPRFLEEEKTIPSFLDKIICELKEMEKNGWDGSDLNEKQLNILTFISDLYLKRNKSKYKIIETPSEIINWFSQWIQSIFTKNELNWKE